MVKRIGDTASAALDTMNESDPRDRREGLADDLVFEELISPEQDSTIPTSLGRLQLLHWIINRNNQDL